MTTTGRRGRLFRREDGALDDRGADLSEDEYAWWAAREKVAGVPQGPKLGGEATPKPSPGSPFAAYWSAKARVDDQPPPAPPPPRPPPKAEAEAEPTEAEPEPADLEVPGGMDLDSAHLVLQIKIGVDWEDITSAHRRLAKLYHPDRLVSYSPDAQALGRTRMAEINAAHATLRSLHFR